MKTLLPSARVQPRRHTRPRAASLVSRAIALYTAGLLAVAGYADAANITWTGGGATPFNWSDSTNWGGTVFTATGSTPVFVGTDGLSNFNDTATSVTGMTFSAGAGAFTLAGNDLTVAGNILNSGGAGVNQTIGINLVSDGGAARTVSAPNGAILTFTGNVTRTTTAVGRGFDLVGGATGGGTYQFSGAVNLTNASVLTTDASHSGVSQRNNTTVNLNSGANVTITGGYWAIGQNSANTTDPAATLNVNNGASMTISATSDFEVGYNFNAAANVNSNRGILNVNSGGAFTAAFGSSTDASGYVRLGVNGSTSGASIAQGAINLNANGTLTTSRTFVTGGTLANVGTTHTAEQGNFVFDGGTLKTDGANDVSDWFQSATSTQLNAQFLPMTSVAINTGGANIDTNGRNATISYGMTAGATAGGGLAKIGTGTLTLSGANAYTGGTTVSAGTLLLSTTGALNATTSLSVANGATLELDNSISLNDAITLTLVTASTLNLNFSGAEQEIVRVLSLNGVLAPDGTYTAAQLLALDGSINFTGAGSLTVAAVPEPATCALIAVGLAGLLGLNRRRFSR